MTDSVRRSPRALVAVALATSFVARHAAAQTVDTPAPPRASSTPEASAPLNPIVSGAPAPVPATASADADTVRSLREAIARLEARVDALTTHGATTAPAPATSTSTAHPPTPASTPVIFGASRPDNGYLLDPIGILLTGYVQSEYQTSEQSQDALGTGGVALNRDRFYVRRARLRLDGSWQWATFSIELDGNTRQGPYFGIRRAEGSLVWRNPNRGAPPYLALSAGLTEISFGRELPTSNRVRYFMERTAGSRAFFAGEGDLGVRVWGGFGVLRYAVGVMNGTPSSDRPGDPGIDYLAAKDIIGRLGFDRSIDDRFRFVGGVSFLVGQGFHAGTDATKPTLQWQDTNMNGVVDAGEIVGVPAQAAVASQPFQHWAVNADVGVRYRTPIGWGQVYGEFTFATNLDRTQNISNPTAVRRDQRQLAFFGAFTQEITRWGIVGFRYDYYHPDADVGDHTGTFTPVGSATHTFSPLVGLQLPDRARLLFQYDVILDSLGRTSNGGTTDLKNNAASVRLQLDF